MCDWIICSKRVSDHMPNWKQKLFNYEQFSKKCFRRTTHKPRRMCWGAAKGRALSPPWWVRWSSLPWGWRVLRRDWFLSLSLGLLYPQLGSVRALGGTDSILNAQSPPHPPVWRDKGKRFQTILMAHRLTKLISSDKNAKCLLLPAWKLHFIEI